MTGITFGIGKSTVIKICDEFTRALIQKKDDFIKFPSDEEELIKYPSSSIFYPR